MKTPFIQGLLGVDAAHAEAALRALQLAPDTVESVDLRCLHKCETSVGRIGLVESLRALALLGEERRADIALVSDANLFDAARIDREWQTPGVSPAHRPEASRRVNGALVTLARLREPNDRIEARAQPSPRDVDELLQEVYSLSLVNRTEAALDRLWEAFEDARLARDTPWCERLFEHADLARLSPELMVAVLAASRRPGLSDTSSRGEFLSKVEAALRGRGMDAAALERLLLRLR